MKKGEKSGPSDRSDKGKSVEEKGKRTSHCTRIGMDFDPKTSKLRDQEAVDKYPAGYGFHWSPEIKLSFVPTMMFLWLCMVRRMYICIYWCWH